MIVDGLLACGARDVAVRVARGYATSLQGSFMPENFDALTGQARKDTAFSWTSAAFLLLAHDSRPALTFRVGSRPMLRIRMVAAVVATLVAHAAWADEATVPTLPLGAKLPAFSLTGVDGKTYTPRAGPGRTCS